MTRPRLLAIDDNPANLTTLARALSDEFTLQLAASGEEGLRLATAERPDLILLDVMMPIIDGFETCRRLKADPALADIPVIFVTAVVDMAAELEGLRLGGADYLHKPINLGIARQRIRNLLEREALRRELERHRGRLQVLIDAQTRELREARRLAEAASRAKSAFLAAMSQELRAPMHTIVGLAALGVGQPDLPPAVTDALKRIHGSSRALLALIDDILEFSRMEAHDIEVEAVAFGVEEVLRKVVDVFAASAQARGLELTSRIDPAIPRRLVGDPLRLGQVLNNLVGNALKFTEAGRVAISVQPEPGDAASATDEADEADGTVRLRFTVHDTGSGISQEDRERVWTAIAGAKAGTTSDEPALYAGGNGLGLAISQRLLGKMGGRLDLDSEPGKGSAFSFAITLAVAAREAGRGTAEEDALRGRRVLVVDPMAASRLALARALADGGMRVSSAATGDEALSLLAAAGTDPGNGFEVVLFMARPEGWQEGVALLRRVRALAGAQAIAPIPRLVVGSTPETQPVLRQDAADAPWDVLLHEPVTPSRILEALATQPAPVPPAGSAAMRATASSRQVAASAPGGHGDAPSTRERPAPDPGFPSIPGIDAGDAHQRLRGNASLFRFLLGQAGAQCGQALTEARAALARGDRVGAASRVHGLQSLLCDLGARDALGLAVRAENALLDPDEADPGVRLDRLTGATEALVAAIAARPAEPAPVTGDAGTLDTAALAALAELLEAHEATALDRHEALRAAIAGWLGPAFSAGLAEAIESLRFGEAARLLRQHSGADGPPTRGDAA
jgi:signal transduction histidine kinase